jgi:hypothetical protein
MIVLLEIGQSCSGVVPPTAKLPYRIKAAFMTSEVVRREGSCDSPVRSRFWPAKHGDFE